jgi:hypothetical protein
MRGHVVEAAGGRIPLIIMIVKFVIWTRLLEFVDEILVPLAAHQLDVARLRGLAHGQRACVLVAGGLLDLHGETQQRPASLSIDV